MPGERHIYSGVYRSGANNDRIDTNAITSRTEKVYSLCLFSHKMSSAGEKSKPRVGVGDGDDADSIFKISLRKVGKRRLFVGVGVGKDADSESRAFRVSSMTGGKRKVNVGVGASDDADSESIAVMTLSRGSMALIVSVDPGDDVDSEELTAVMVLLGGSTTLAVSVGVGDDANSE